MGRKKIKIAELINEKELLSWETKGNFFKTLPQRTERGGKIMFASCR
jgi:hypothetical protein